MKRIDVFLVANRCGHWRGIIIYSLIETAKANGIEPYTYLNLILTDMQYMGKPFSNEELESFMPWSEEIKDSIEKRTKPAPLTEE